MSFPVVYWKRLIIHRFTVASELAELFRVIYYLNYWSWLVVFIGIRVFIFMNSTCCASNLHKFNVSAPKGKTRCKVQHNDDSILISDTQSSFSIISLFLLCAWVKCKVICCVCEIKSKENNILEMSTAKLLDDYLYSLCSPSGAEQEIIFNFYFCFVALLSIFSIINWWKAFHQHFSSFQVLNVSIKHTVTTYTWG